MKRDEDARGPARMGSGGQHAPATLPCHLGLALLFGLSILPAAVAQEDSWATKSAMRISRVFHASCAVAGRLYVFGGQRQGGGPGVASVEEYDPVTDTWRDRADMPSARLGMTANAVEGKCYVMGGATEPSGNGLRRVDEYDPINDSWRRRADMKTARAAAASAVMNGKIYIAGGWAVGSPQSAALSELEIYDPASDLWTSGVDMPTARATLAASTADDEVFFIGGGSAALGTIDTQIVESYDPVTNTWTRRADMPTGRGVLTAAAVDGLLYAIGGGFNVGELDSVEEFDPRRNTWRELTRMPTARWGVTNGIIGRKIHVLGGSTELGVGHNSLSTHEVYTAKPFGVNPGISDVWFNDATAGQGFLIVVFPDTGIVFLAWFTFDTELPPEDAVAILGAAEHRWVTAQGPFDGDTANLTAYLTEGGVFDMAEPPAVTDTEHPIGTITIVWHDCENATLTYDIDPPGVVGQIELGRIVPDNVVLCQALGQ